MPLLRKASGGGSLAFDDKECRRALAALADPDNGCQLFGMPCFRHINATVTGVLAENVRVFCEDGNQVYVVLNPVPKNWDKRANAGCVVSRRWLFVDVDPAKPADHKDDSATDGEKFNAEVLGNRIRDDLYSWGWSLPLRIDSGNGNYLLYRVDLPNDKLSRALVKDFLHALAAKYDGDNGHVGKECSNADRLAKLPGTTAAKGPNTPERPHRPCRITQLPESGLPIISAEQIKEATRRLRPEPPPVVVPPAAPKPPAPTGLKAKAGTADTSAYGKKALLDEAKKVAESRAGGRNNQLNRAAFRLGQLIAAGVLTREEVERELTWAAKECGLLDDPGCGERGVSATVASGIEAGLAEPRAVPERNGVHASASAAPPPDAEGYSVTIDGETVLEAPESDLLEYDVEQLSRCGGGRSVTMYTMTTLAAMDLPEPRWVVPGILSEGLNILAGKPKQGKSFMALNLGLTIAAGGNALGDVNTMPGDVLYLSLEDNLRRVQQRARRMVKGLDVELTNRLTIATAWVTQGRGGLRLLETWSARCQQPSLVIIDVWGRFKPPSNAKGNAYDQDYAQLVTLKTFVEARGFHALVLMHCRKMKSDDVLEEISGTMGLSGAADGIVVLNRSRSSNEAKIYVTGRDVAPQELALEFDPETFCWKSLGPSEQVVGGKLQTTIIAFMKSQAGVVLHTKTIADAIQNIPDGIRPVLHRLRDKGVIRQQNNAWVYPGPSEVDAVAF